MNLNKYSRCRYLTIFFTISLTILLLIMAGPASFVSSNYHAVFQQRMERRQLPSSSKGGSGSINNSTSPLGSSTFLNVITKVGNTKGGTAKPSDFTITVSGKSPSSKSFSGSSSGISVTLNAGKYKVTASGPSGYTQSILQDVLVLQVEEHQLSVLSQHLFHNPHHHHHHHQHQPQNQNQVVSRRLKNPPLYL